MQGNIVLCGFMGSGKTSVGRRLAKLLDREFVDLDQYIEEQTGMTVSQIFAQEGEDGFRRKEAQAVAQVAPGNGRVIASGGGTVLFPQNVELFHQGGSVILYLDVPLAALQERLKNDKRRPLLQKPNRRQVIADLYAKRCPLYRAAADRVIDAGAPAIVVAKRIAALWQPESGGGQPGGNGPQRKGPGRGKKNFLTKKHPRRKLKNGHPVPKKENAP